MADVTLKNVSKIYEKNVRAVDRVSIQIPDREFVVLVGPSGCGKSTTLRMIAGLEAVSEGEIYIGGRLVNDVPPKDRDIAMVFQNYALYPHMSVFDNMAFGLKLRKYPKDEIKKRVFEAAEILNITGLLDRKPKALSGGQRQRVAVGRAIVRHPKVFLFDEPLSNLDAKLRVQMRAEIKKLHKRLATTMVYVTHDQVEAMTMGDRIVVLNAGRVQQIDSPLNLYHHPANRFVAGFIGSPAMNFISCSVKENGALILNEGNVQISLPIRFHHSLQKYRNSEIELGIRPEDIFLPGNNEKCSASLKARVEVVEPMGNEVFVYLRTGKHPFVARLKSSKLPAIGEELRVCLNVDKLHLFDKKTGETIDSRA